MKSLLYFLLLFLYNIPIFAEDSDLHWTENIFQDKNNRLVKKDISSKICYISSNSEFNKVQNYTKFYSIQKCLDSGGKLR